MLTKLKACISVALLVAVWVVPAFAQNASAKKVLVIADLEGVDGVFNFDLQCIPFKSPLYQESRKALTGEVNAAIQGLSEGGATKVVVYDNHYGGHNLSSAEINPKALLLAGSPVSPTLGLDSSYKAIIFIGLHSMAGTRNGVLPHSFSWDIENIWVNGKKVGEIGSRVMLAGQLGIPAIMLAGDAAACKEFLGLVPNAECAQVKQGARHTGGYSLSHTAACNLIRQKAKAAIEHLAQIKPYHVTGPAKVKVEYTSPATPSFLPRPGVEQLDGRTWVFEGKDFIDAWLKFRSF
ncbi:MAG TPA: M55 family metallopeptidase [Terriglobia bacterium]|nr:M55 family metallopeptidase [Terriglobia bacterium]